MIAASTNPVFDAALSLPRHSREMLADLLWASLEEPPHPEVLAEHLEEIERRQRDIEEGRAKTIPAEEVFAKYRIKEAP
jgi:putative addiction module component (TIGR02574 family)